MKWGCIMSGMNCPLKKGSDAASCLCSSKCAWYLTARKMDEIIGACAIAVIAASFKKTTLAYECRMETRSVQDFI